MAVNREFVITDVRMPFWRMVVVIFKVSLAAIPAAILVWLVLMALALLAAVIPGLAFLAAGAAAGAADPVQ